MPDANDLLKMIVNGPEILAIICLITEDFSPSRPTPLLFFNVLPRFIISVGVHGARNMEFLLGSGNVSLIHFFGNSGMFLPNLGQYL